MLACEEVSTNCLVKTYRFGVVFIQIGYHLTLACLFLEYKILMSQYEAIFAFRVQNRKKNYIIQMLNKIYQGDCVYERKFTGKLGI